MSEPSDPTQPEVEPVDNEPEADAVADGDDTADDTADDAEGAEEE